MPTPSEDGLVAKALTATRETTKIELLREFSPAAPGGWCELLKDIVAFANSGGGVIAIGLQKNGSPTGWNASEFLATDAAQLTSMLATYLGGQTPDVESVGAQKDGQPVALLIVGARTGAPIVFEHAGIYTDADRRETTAFLPGTVYFRHGTHSAPGSTKDISRFIDREISTQRREWLKNVRTVAAAPREARVLVLRPSKKDPSASVPQLRVVDDPDAPAVARTDFDITHPYRQTELVAAVNERLGQKVVTGYDL